MKAVKRVLLEGIHGEGEFNYAGETGKDKGGRTSGTSY